MAQKIGDKIKKREKEGPGVNYWAEEKYKHGVF